MPSNNSYANYTFRSNNGRLQHQARTLNDLAHKEHFGEAEEAAQALKDQALDTYFDMLVLDNSESDLNGRPGEVLVKNHPYEGGEISGRAVRHPEGNAMPLEVMEVQKSRDGEKAGLSLTLDPYDEKPYLAVNRKSEGVSESLTQGSYVRDGVTEYTVSADFHAASPIRHLAHEPYAKDHFPVFGARRKESEGQVARDTETGELRYEPRTLGDLKGSEELQKLAETGNRTVDTVKAVLEGFQQLDGTDADQNPKEGEVLLQDELVAGRRVTGFLSEFQVKSGDTSERTVGGTFPFLQAVAGDGEETFQAFLTKDSDYSMYDHQIPGSVHSTEATYRHDDGEKLVEVSVNGPGGEVRVYSPEGPTFAELDRRAGR